MTRVCAVLLWAESSQFALIFNALILWQTPEVLKLLTHAKHNYACMQVWCLKAFSQGVPPGRQLGEPGLLAHTHLYSERTEISFSNAPYRLQCVATSWHRSLQFTIRLAGLIQQIVANLNTNENCLSIHTTTSGIADTRLKTGSQLCSVHKVQLGANFGCPVFDGLNVPIVLGWVCWAAVV